MKRNRLFYFLLILLTILLGISTRKLPDLYPLFIQAYAGDTLWALMVFWGFGFLLPKKSTRFVFMLSLIFSFGIEISQLFHPLWLEGIRATTLGALIFGFTFVWNDLLCYMVGGSLGLILEVLTHKKTL